MLFVFIVIGILMVVTGIRGTHADLGALLKSEFTGTPNFLVWIVAIGIIGGLGYIKSIRPITNAFLFLVLVVLFLSNGGFFNQLRTQLRISP